jgi:beta-glucosidase
MAKATFRFPQDFRWGTATAAHQVEGENRNNDWWTWEQGEGNIKDDSSSRVSCNWWKSADSDLDRMVELGLNSQKLSLEWSRIEPNQGQWDETAIDRYRALLVGLRDRGIEPLVTLHHTSNPQWFSEQGGWENKDLAIHKFSQYVKKVVGALGDLTDFWCTINEPNNTVLMGWLWGRWPPGKRDFGQAMRVTRTLLQSHAAAYRIIHELNPEARVGLNIHYVVFDPLNAQSFLDRRAAILQDTMFNKVILMALGRGRLPVRTRRLFIRGVKDTFDWIGASYFYRRRVVFDSRQMNAYFGRLEVPEGADAPVPEMGETYAKGLLRVARRLAPLGRPIYITANGVHDLTDDYRPRFLLTHLHQLWHAIQFNLPVYGYYHHTLVDCFEWDDGYSLRFGLVKLNRKNGSRAMRRSGMLYADVCKANALDDEIVARYDPELADRIFKG